MTPNEFGQVRYGVEMYSMKEEDFFKMQCLNNKTMFGVFDGVWEYFMVFGNSMFNCCKRILKLDPKKRNR